MPFGETRGFFLLENFFNSFECVLLWERFLYQLRSSGSFCYNQEECFEEREKVSLFQLFSDLEPKVSDRGKNLCPIDKTALSVSDGIVSGCNRKFKKHYSSQLGKTLTHSVKKLNRVAKTALYMSGRTVYCFQVCAESEPTSVKNDNSLWKLRVKNHSFWVEDFLPILYI